MSNFYCSMPRLDLFFFQLWTWSSYSLPANHGINLNNWSEERMTLRDQADILVRHSYAWTRTDKVICHFHLKRNLVKKNMWGTASTGLLLVGQKKSIVVTAHKHSDLLRGWISLLQRWEFIKENKKTRIRARKRSRKKEKKKEKNTLSTKKTIKKKRKKRWWSKKEKKEKTIAAK